jgi:uncharacterized membrane protein YraQ (UPF0718 family)
MTKLDFFELKLSESKDLLNHINDSIRETRNRLYFIIALIFAVFGYLVDDVLNNEFTSTKSFLLYSLILFIGFIFYQCKHAITPLELRFNGIEPNSFKKLKYDKDKVAKEKILNTYQKSIDVNGSHLKMISKAYNKAFKSILIWLLLVSIFLSCQWVVQCYIRCS